MDKHLTRAARSVLQVRTFHAFFMDMVRSHGRLLTGAQPTFITPDRERIMKADRPDTWPAETARLAAEDSRYVFNLLAPTAAELLERSEAIRELYSDIYPLIIVDEFQDTDADQWRAVKALAASSTIICLADADQRIYDFVPGVDEHRIDHAIEQLNPAVFDLEADNFRSSGTGLLDYANAVLRDTPMPPPASVRIISYNPPYMPGPGWKPRLHQVVIALRDSLAQQLGTTATVAVLAKTNSTVAQISDVLSTDQSGPNGVLPAVDHTLAWDMDLVAAAAYTVASIMEWPGLTRTEAVSGTLAAIVDYYRMKLAEGVAGARKKIQTLEGAITALRDGKNPVAKTAKVLNAAFDAGLEFVGNPVDDWRTARAVLGGSAELDEVLKQARVLRLLKATDSLAWALTDAWDGRASYIGAAAVVRRVLAEEMVAASRQEQEPVSLMTMHRSKGKEFDAVVIYEGAYTARLLSDDGDPKRIQADRRLLRVAITRARHGVVIIRPSDAPPLITPRRR
jgi:DNA helicase-2/ATP-dependent DNA helicase PcrA